MARETRSEDVVQSRLERICIYGAAKTRKTQLATSIPRDEKWGEDVLYVSADEHSEKLPSVLHPERIIVIDPKPEPSKDGKPVRWDPLTEYVGIASATDWQKKYPKAKTMIVDTVSMLSEHLLAAYTETGAVQKGHKSLGVPNTLTHHSQPDKGDFGAAQRSTDFILDYFFELPLHLILLFHQHWAEPKEGSLEALVGGPATVGEAQVRKLPARFDTVLHLVAGSKGDVTINTEPTVLWPAGIRHRRIGKRLGPILMADDPREFWTKHYDPLVKLDPALVAKEA